jgi:transcriptional regulator with XRE-family HTH domain
VLDTFSRDATLRAVIASRARQETSPPAKSPFALNLRAAQAVKGLTTDELARELGISARLVQKWRAGSVTPRYENVRRLAEVLDVDVAYFYGTPATEVPA